MLAGLVMHPSISNGNSGGGGASGSSGGGTNEGSEAPPISGQGSGSPQQFCLRWNNYQSNLTNVFDQLLQNESFVDVTLACEGHSVKAHKIVLSACSPYFQALFTDNPCQHPIVILKDILWPELKAVIEFMYKGEINVNQEQIGPLLKVAESLKIRGLAEVNNEHDISPADGKSQNCQSLNSPLDSLKTPRSQSRASNPSRKRRRTSLERHSPESSMPESPSKALELLSSPISPPHQSPAPIQSQSQNSICSNLGPPANPLPLPPPQTPHQQQRDSMLDDLDIKPGIAEMIREEERAKMLESSHAWLGASTSSLPADSYQYQLQSIWQKCWNTNQSLVHNLRFRERGPLKSWRPETMAEAILSVLKDGLSLSQAARKFDIPYPTFVLYANRVHNMLGPSVDGGADLRPKGRGRPQRILLGLWPEDHIQTVIRAVVFRDPQHIKDEPSMALGYPRISEPLSLYSGCMNGPEPPGSPSSHTSTILAAAQSLRQQMLAASHSSDILPSLANGAPLIMGTPSPSPVNSSPPSSPVSNNNLEVGIGVSGVPYKPTNFSTSRPESLFQDDIEDLVIRNTPTSEGNKDQPLPLVIEQRSE